MVINIIGGLYIGTVHNEMTFGQAASLFTKLTIGDGLVSQVPALLISLAAGLLVTRSAKKSNMPQEFLQQLLGNPRALAIAGVFLMLMMITNLPALPMATLGIGCIGLAVIMGRQNRQAVQRESRRQQAEREAADEPTEKRPEDYLAVDPMELSLGWGLLSLADPERGGDLMTRITGLRNRVAEDIGILLPKLRVRDNEDLHQLGYEFQIAGARVGRGSLLPDQLLAIDSGATTGVVEGENTREPAYGRPAVWIDHGRREQAAIYGYTIAEPNDVLMTHLQRIVNRHADELLTRDATKHLLDELREVSPAVVDELIPGQMKLSEVQQILQMLLREDVPIRQLGIILETIGDHVSRTHDPYWLVERARQRLARTISTRFRDEHDRIRVITLGPDLENLIREGVEHNETGLVIKLSSEIIEQINALISKALQVLKTQGATPIILVDPRVRIAVRKITANAMPDLRVLSYNEITKDTAIDSMGIASGEA